MGNRRCRSWARSPKAHPSLHKPGRCHRCWRPCRHRVDRAGDSRCTSCTEALITAGEPWVRLAIISEPNPTSHVIDALVGDGDVTVNYTARWQRAHAAAVETADSDADREHVGAADEWSGETERRERTTAPERSKAVPGRTVAEPAKITPHFHDENDDW